MSRGTAALPSGGATAGGATAGGAMTGGAGPLAWGLLLLLGVIWGSSFMLTKIAVRDLPPLTLAALRLCLAAGLIIAASRAARARAPRLSGDGRLWRFALASAVLGNVLPFWMVSWSQLHIASALTGLLMAPMPLISLLLAHLLIAGERMTPARVIGFLTGLSGVALLIGTEAASGLGAGGGVALLAQIASIGAMLCYALNGIVLKRAAAPDPLGISAAILGLAAAMALPLALWLERPDLGAVPAQAWLLVAALGLGATALAQIVLMKILSLAGPPFLASVNYQVPLWAAVFGLVFLGEALPGAFWPALGLILAGLAIAQFGGRLAARRG